MEPEVRLHKDEMYSSEQAWKLQQHNQVCEFLSEPLLSFCTGLWFPVSRGKRGTGNSAAFLSLEIILSDSKFTRFMSHSLWNCKRVSDSFYHVWMVKSLITMSWSIVQFHRVGNIVQLLGNPSRLSLLNLTVSSVNATVVMQICIVGMFSMSISLWEGFLGGLRGPTSSQLSD